MKTKEPEITRAFIEKEASRLNGSKKYCADDEVVAILLASALLGAKDNLIARFLRLKEAYVKSFGDRLRKNGIWHKDGTITADWFDKESGVVALMCDAAVASGWIKRTSK